MTTWALYGATGYTGPLIAERAVERGHKPLLMGRSADKLAPLAKRLGLDHRAVSLDDPKALREALRGRTAVIHAAGPFTATSEPMVQACLDERVSYLDITGEPSVFKDIYARDAEAKARGIALVPGIGFDVVPSNCLAAHVVERAPHATHLEIVISGLARPSAGSVKSAVPVVLEGGRIIRDGHELSWPLGRGTRRFKLSSREVLATPAPIADLDGAFRATGLPNVTLYYAIPSRLATLASIGWPAFQLALPVLRLALGGGRLDRYIERKVPGGTAESRAAGHSLLYGRAYGPDVTAEAWLETPEGYEFTAHAAVRCIERLFARKPSGALAPATAFGKDLITDVPGCLLGDTLPLGTGRG
jgi:short subunit dehydrogenase-like uncharacterized protein